MAIQVYSLGAAQEVTGSKHILEIDGKIYMIDCGAFQGKRSVADEKNRRMDIPHDKIQAVVLTHAHYDHCGLIPFLTKNGFTGNIYATPATRDLANLVMMDSARIQSRDAEYLRKQSTRKGEKFDWTPLFTEKDCVAADNQKNVYSSQCTTGIFRCRSHPWFSLCKFYSVQPEKTGKKFLPQTFFKKQKHSSGK